MKSVSVLIFLCSCLTAAEPDVLPGTARWQFPADIAAEQYRELESYLDREIRAKLDARPNFSDPAAARQELRNLIGAIDSFLPRQATRQELGSFGKVKASLVEWPLLPLGSTPPTHG